MPPKSPLSVPKKQKNYYSGKQKCHRVKMQVMTHYQTGQILSTCFAKGRIHDFKLLKLSMAYWLFKPFIVADKGYQGIHQLGLIALIPFKAKKRQAIDRYLKQINLEINRRRIGIEHVFGVLKRFRILSTTYRNRRSRLGLRFNLIAAIYNLELLNN